MNALSQLSRRQFLQGGLIWAAATAPLLSSSGQERDRLAGDFQKALVAFTLDLEMSRNFPTWDQTEWDYRKGDLDQASKEYSVEAARRIRAAGGVIHFFVVGRVFEQPDVSWLEQLIRSGHPVGNHTYDHINLKAEDTDQLQYRFRRAPWLVAGRRVGDLILENIRMTEEAMRVRLGSRPQGFRTPGGFGNGLSDRADLQQMLLSLGYEWISSKYPRHSTGEPGQDPAGSVFQEIVDAQREAQPFQYPSGLVEVPMSPISDISAFRSGRWSLDSYLRAIRESLEWAIENRATFDLLAHPSCLGVVDPGFKAVDLICEMVRKAGSRAALVDLDTLARRAQLSSSGTA